MEPAIISARTFPPPFTPEASLKATEGASLGAKRTIHPQPASRTAPAQAGEQKRISDAAKDFEAVFIAQMLAPLFSSVSTPEIAGGGKSEEFFKSLLQESYATAMAARGGFGIADHVKSTLINLQSVHQETGQ